MLGIHALAERELEIAFEYLEAERPGHGYIFLERYHELVQQIIRLPETGMPVVGYARRYDIRKFQLKQFSYALVVALVGGSRTIIALQHHRRRDDYWSERLR